MKNKVLSIFSLIVFCLKLGAVIPQQDRANNLAAGYSQFPQNGNAQNRELIGNTQAANLQQNAATNQAGTYNRFPQNFNAQNRASLAYQNVNYQNVAQYQQGAQNLQNNQYYNTANTGVQNRYVQRPGNNRLPIPATGAFAFNYGGQATATASANTQSNIRNGQISSQYNYGLANNNRGAYPGFNLQQLVRNEFGGQPIVNQAGNQPNNVQQSQPNVAVPGGHAINTKTLDIPAYINTYTDTGEKISSALEKVRNELEEILHSPGLTKIEEPISYPVTGNQYKQTQQPVLPTTLYTRPQQSVPPPSTVPINRYEPSIPTPPIVPSNEPVGNSYPHPQQSVPPSNSVPINQFEQPLPTRPYKPTNEQFGNQYRRPQESLPPSAPTNQYQQSKQPNLPTEKQYQQPQPPIIPTENQYEPQPNVPTENQYEPQQPNLPTENQYEPQQPIVSTENQYEPQQPIVPTEIQYEPQEPNPPTENQYQLPQQPIVPTENQYQQPQQSIVPTENQYEQPQQPNFPPNEPQIEQPVQPIPVPVNNNEEPQQTEFSPSNYPSNRQPPRNTLPIAPNPVNLSPNQPTIPENSPQKRFRVLYPNGTVEYISESDLEKFVQQTQNVEVIRKPSNPVTNNDQNQPNYPTVVNNEQTTTQNPTNNNNDETNPDDDNTPFTNPDSLKTLDEVILPTLPSEDIATNDQDFDDRAPDDEDNIKNDTVPITTQDSNHPINDLEYPYDDSEYEPEDHNVDSGSHDEDHVYESEVFTPEVIYNIPDEPIPTTPSSPPEISTDYPYYDSNLYEEPNETLSNESQPSAIEDDVQYTEPTNTEVPEVTTELNPDSADEGPTTTTPAYESNDDNRDNYEQSSDIYSQNTKPESSDQQSVTTTENPTTDTSNIYYQETVSNNQGTTGNNKSEETAQPVKRKRKVKKIRKIIKHKNGTVSETTSIVNVDDDQVTTPAPTTTTPIATTTATPVTTTAPPVTTTAPPVVTPATHKPRDIIITTSGDDSESNRRRIPEHPEDYVTVKPIIWLNKNDSHFWNRLKGNNTVLNIVYQLQYSHETEKLEPVSGVHRAVVLHGQNNDATPQCNCTTSE